MHGAEISMLKAKNLTQLNRITQSLILSVSVLVLSGCNTDPLETKSTIEAGVTKANYPNVVILYVDDLGYGDLSAYGAKTVETPNIDALSKDGIRFTDAHSGASTGTSSHYSLLTGEHGFRENVTLLYEDKSLIIPTNKATLPKIFQQAGYSTAFIGKWLLGLGDGLSPIDWNDEISPGPLDIGFDYSFIIPGAGDKVPTVFIENTDVLNLNEEDPIVVNYQQKIGNRPTGAENPDLLLQEADHVHSGSIINGLSRKGWMQGGVSAEFKDQNIANVLTNMANFFIIDNKDTPFFLMYSFHDIHVPRLTNEMFAGKSAMGPRGDAIAQMDWITGQIVNTLKVQGLLNNTLIILTSDNGPVLNDGYKDQAIEKLGAHKPSGTLRGGKYSAYEAGTRVPTIVHYPNRVEAGTSDALMSQLDLFASLSTLIGVTLKDNEAIDSQDHLDAWLSDKANGRTELLQESQTFSLRSQEWKYISPSKKQINWIENDKNIESGISLSPQLYNLKVDISEQNNLATEMPEDIKRYQQTIDEIKTTNKRKDKDTEK